MGNLVVERSACLIPALLGLDGSIWFATGRGVRGSVVSDARGQRQVDVVVEPASHYDAIMDKSCWMPCVRERMEWSGNRETRFDSAADVAGADWRNGDSYRGVADR